MPVTMEAASVTVSAVMGWALAMMVITAVPVALVVKGTTTV